MQIFVEHATSAKPSIELWLLTREVLENIGLTTHKWATVKNSLSTDVSRVGVEATIDALWDVHVRFR